MTLTWQIASPEEFIPICELFKASGLGSGYNEIKRRITAPLLLRQLITFYENSKLCGFVTFAFMGENAEKSMPSTGIFASDWRSGENFWVVDFASKGDGFKMLRSVTKGLGIRKARYFRNKFRETREVRS